MKKRALLPALLLFWTASNAAAGDFYVSQDGAGAQNGTSYKNRWGGFSKVLWGGSPGHLGIGDTLHVCGEIRETLRVPISGTRFNPIVVTGECDEPGIVNGADIVEDWTPAGAGVLKRKFDWTVRLLAQGGKPLVPVKWEGDEKKSLEALSEKGAGYWMLNEAAQTAYVFPVDSGAPIEAARREERQAVVYALGVQDLVIEHLHVKNSNSSGIKVSSGSSGVVVRHNTTSGIAEWGILVERSQNIAVHDNEIYDTCLKFPTGGEGLRIYESKGGEVFNNHIHHVNNVGIDLTGGASGFKVHHNRIHDLTSPESLGGIYSDNAQDNLYYDNLVENVSNNAGIGLSSETSGKASSGNRVFNNVVRKAKAGILLGGSYGANETRSTGNTIENNIVSDSGEWSELFIGDSSNHEMIRNNVFYRKASGSVMTANGTNGHVLDNNRYFRADGYPHVFTWGGQVMDLAAYQKASGQDPKSVYSDPNLTGNEEPGA